MDITTGNGPFTVTTGAGPIQLNSQGGPFDVNTAGGAINLNTANGPFTVSTGNGPCNINSGNSPTDINTSNAPVNINTGTGPITAISINGTITLNAGNGNVNMTAGTTTINGNVTVNGSGTVSGTWTVSDARYKTNVTALDNALAKVMRLRGVSYDYRRADFPERNFPAGRQVGFVAQEVERVVPELVVTNTDGYKAVAYQNITALLTEAVKQQQAQIQALQARITQLESALNRGSSTAGSAKSAQPADLR
jgi:phage baseplate assembly protein gpV